MPYGALIRLNIEFLLLFGFGNLYRFFAFSSNLAGLNLYKYISTLSHVKVISLAFQDFCIFKLKEISTEPK